MGLIQLETTGGASMSTVIGSLVTACTDVANNAMDAISRVLPVALPVGGAIIAVLIGWRFFKRVAK